MRANLSNLSRLVLLIVLFTFLDVWAEESSILDGATQNNSDAKSDVTWNLISLIDGNFKSMYHSKTTISKADGSKEVQIILP